MGNRDERRATAANLRRGKISLDFRVVRWLDAPSPWQGKFRGFDLSPAELGMTNRQVLALLMAKNGFKPKVTGWGQFSGPFGLEPHEAFLLMELTPYLQGLIDGGELNTQTVIGEHLEPELQRLATEFEALSAAMPLTAAEESAASEPAGDQEDAPAEVAASPGDAVEAIAPEGAAPAESSEASA